MPYHPMANPDLAGILMAQGIQKLGEGLGEAASAGVGSAMGGSAGSGAAKGASVSTGSGITSFGGGGGADSLLDQLKSFGLTDEQIAKFKQYLTSPGAFQNGGGGMGPSDFGAGF